MPKLSIELTHALGRKRGELNISVLELSRRTGVSRWTLDKILSGNAQQINKRTLDKIDNWLYEQV